MVEVAGAVERPSYEELIERVKRGEAFIVDSIEGELPPELVEELERESGET